MLKILHTSDWHLGRTLCGRTRWDEFDAFLRWLIETIRRERVDVLLVAGDLFDNCCPTHRAQEIYYRFLNEVNHTSCRHVVLIGGNHDSPTFLDAPKELLRYCRVHVRGRATEKIAEEVLTLDDAIGQPALIVCAVPYLRDQEVRHSEPGETPDQKRQNLLNGIRRHYAEIGECAAKANMIAGGNLPIIVMGHLFTLGGQTIDGDGVRDLYVGTLNAVGEEIFPKADYLALGHLHIPQKVGGSEFRRYSGSPIPMGFGEAGQKKICCLAEWDGSTMTIEEITIPIFRRLVTIRGGREAILARLTELKTASEPIWIEIICAEGESTANLIAQIDEIAAGSLLEILRVKTSAVATQTLGRAGEMERLATMGVFDVFQRTLDKNKVSPEERLELNQVYREAVQAVEEDDIQAE